MALEARVGSVVARANDDVQLLGENVLLNCDRTAPVPDWVTAPARAAARELLGVEDASEAHVATLFDLRGLQSAAPAMRWDTVPPGSDVELRTLHPRFGSWRFRLPPRPPRM